MSRFIQLHLLTTYPPSNPNRDDLGRPKTARFGNTERMRISSQSLKRALRTSDVFEERLKNPGNMGDRTQRLGEVIETHLLDKQVAADKALEIAKAIASAYGKIDDQNKHHDARIKQLAFISPDEKKAALALADKLASGEIELPSATQATDGAVTGKKSGKKDQAADAIKKIMKEWGLLKLADGAVDIAMFGRMLADNPDFNRDAAVQIAHAITTNRVTIENDFYTAVDDLKKPAEDAGAGFIGELGFGSGVFYIYACINRDLLVNNLDGDVPLAETATIALIEALATASPDGKKNSFAHGGRAQYILAERGNQQPRTLAGAFLKPVHNEDLMSASIKRLEKLRKDMDDAYGDCADDHKVMHLGAEGSVPLIEIAQFCAGATAAKGSGA